jgi:hypothetical protein
MIHDQDASLILLQFSFYASAATVILAQAVLDDRLKLLSGSFLFSGVSGFIVDFWRSGCSVFCFAFAWLVSI